MNLYLTEAKISKDAIVGLLQKANLDDSTDKLLAVIGSLLDDDCNLVIPEAVVEATNEVNSKGIKYPYAPSTGIADLARLLAEENIGKKTLEKLRSNNIYKSELVTAGCTNAISATLAACTGPEDRIIIQSPHWSGFDSIVNSIARKPLLNFQILDKNENFNFDNFTEVINSDTSKQTIIILNIPFDNPLGKDFGSETWDRIGDILNEHYGLTRKKTLLILDAAYIDFGPRGKDYDRLSFLPKLFQKVQSPYFNVVVAVTISKSFTMYGARVGAAILLSSDLEAVNNWTDVVGGVVRGTLSSVNEPGQEIALNILRDPNKLANVHSFQAATAKLLDKRRKIFTELMEPKLVAGIKLIKPDGGFFYSLKIEDKNFAVRLSEKLIESHTYIPLISEHFLRIPVCEFPEHLLEEAAKRIINAYKGSLTSSSTISRMMAN